MSSDMLLNDRIYTDLTLNSAINLIVTAFIITLVASLYPARMAKENPSCLRAAHSKECPLMNFNNQKR